MINHKFLLHNYIDLIKWFTNVYDLRCMLFLCEDQKDFSEVVLLLNSFFILCPDFEKFETWNML